MMSVQNQIERIQNIFENWKIRVQQRKADKHRLALMGEASRRIQVREFDNILCLSIDGIPVLPMRDFDKQILADARLTLFNYLKTRR